MLILDRVIVFSSQPLWLYLSSCQSQGGEFGSNLESWQGQEGELDLPFIMPESGGKWRSLSSCQGEGGELGLSCIMPESGRYAGSMFHHAKVRKASWIYLSSCQSLKVGGSAFHDAKVRELSWVYLASCQSQEGRLALCFMMPRSGSQVGSTFHHARVWR
jgi:hypothetical protein